MAHEAAVVSAACRNCGTGLAGPFCHGCGEPRPHDHEFQWKHFLHDAIHEFLHLDGKIFRTLWLLIRCPGFLTREYWEGRRTGYIRPLRLYIVIAAIHLIAMSHSFYRLDMFKARDRGGQLQRLVSGIAERTHRTRAQVEEAVNVKLAKTYSVMQYFAVLGFTLFPWLLYRRKQHYYLTHLIFALHLYCFYFLLTTAVSLVLTPSQWAMSPLPLVTLLYIALALRLLYQENWWTVVGKALVLRIGLFLAEFALLGIALAVALYQVGSAH